jgi:hypothetical protein
MKADVSFRNIANMLEMMCPTLGWSSIRMQMDPIKVQDKCHLRLERLREMGHELRRPEADFLRDGIYEIYEL